MLLQPATLTAPPRAHPGLSRLAKRLRWWPFALAAAGSVLASALAPQGRKPFQFDLDVGLAALQFSLAKDPHIGAAALLAALAVAATGRARWGLAWALTVAVGGGWELGQSTVIGHTARLADLAPDALGAAFGCLWGVCMLCLLKAGCDALD